jgi:hypothetical protein
MSLNLLTYSLFTLVLLTVGTAGAQLVTDQGVLSGSGLTVLPTATTVPSTEFQLQISRIGYSNTSGGGLNVVGVSAGLSETMEWYAKVMGEQVGTFSSEVSYGFGGKFRLPLMVPLVRRLAIWTDVTSSDQYQPTVLFPTDAIRTGVVATFDSNGVRPTLLVGVSRIAGRTRPLIGGGVTIASGNHMQIGFEIVHGYLSARSTQIAATAAVRVLSNIGLRVSPGYLAVGDISTASLTIGISCATVDIDFHPLHETRRDDDFILPTIEEIERQQKEEQGKASGDGALLQDPQAPDSSGIGMPSEKSVPSGEPSQKSPTKGLMPEIFSPDKDLYKELLEKENQ